MDVDGNHRQRQQRRPSPAGDIGDDIVSDYGHGVVVRLLGAKSKQDYGAKNRVVSAEPNINSLAKDIATVV
jgi:hypothetical protein